MNRLVAHVASHVGRVRTRQEDAAGCDGWIHQGLHGELVSMTLNRSGTFVVADGLGGHPAGDRAARIAAGVISCGVGDLAERFSLAHQQILTEAERTGDTGMASTAVALKLDRNGIVIANVGDSRAYEVGRDLLLVSIDDTPQRPPGIAESSRTTTITQVLGGPTPPDVHQLRVSVEPAMRFLLCSDGLTAHLPDPEIEAVLRGATEARATVQQHVVGALTAGGSDNVTVGIVDIQGGGAS
ncbi:MAG: serine/threonine-protein phosphatase [Chloroflexi bacterium]|nr:serine/threonine-protein phosphatase [Chloroflexota bacterium]